MMTRDEEVTLKSVAHSLLLKWDSDRILIGLRKNSAYMQQDIIRVLKEFMDQHDQAQRAVIDRLEELEVTYTDANHKLEEQIEQQAKENKTLREALQLLYDCQNGCPLPKYEADWTRAMELAQQALKEVSG